MTFMWFFEKYKVIAYWGFFRYKNLFLWERNFSLTRFGSYTVFPRNAAAAVCCVELAVSVFRAGTQVAQTV
jgi:hypothetical protein